MTDRDAALLRPKPTLELVRYPRCESCFDHGVIVPNPEGRAFCPQCGQRMAKGDHRKAQSVVLRPPFWAAVSYGIADRLVQFHDWLKRKPA
jgi:hypothetical protein